MKIAVPTQSISKSLFIAKRKDSDDLELLFYAPSSIDETFFKLDDDFHFSYLSYNLSNAITPVEEIYDIAFFLPTLLAFVKEEDKDDPELFKDLFLSKLINFLRSSLRPLPTSLITSFTCQPLALQNCNNLSA